MNYKDWKEIPIPKNMHNLAHDKRGYPVPYIVARDKHGVPQFTINDADKVWTCLKHGRCAICGGHLGTDIWFTGGYLSAFHQHGAYIDTPVHYECGTYALQVCPYLAITKFQYRPVDLDKLNDKFNHERIFVDPTVLSERPAFFVFSKARKFSVKVIDIATRYLIPERPFIEVEYWNEGKRITRADALALIPREHILDITLPPE
jgi:hypothetical protein